jgi:signal transduction histidine kinase
VPRALAPGLDPILEQAASDGGVRLVKRIDAVTDPRLASVLQGGRNVVVAPMIPARSGSLGFVILQRVGPTGVNPWVLSVIERYISHAALTLRNRTLRDELERSLSENRLLQDLLAIQNEQLEETVQIRTADLQEALEDLRIADGERRVLLSRLVAAQEDERHRVANDIHDDPLQKLAALSMQLQLLRGTARPETVEMLDKMIVTVRGTMTSMRQMIFDLRPSALDEEGLGAAILELLQTRCLDLDFDVDDQLTHDPPDDLCVILYRIVQEALANVLKHAEATSVRVSLLERRDGVLVTVEDDGKGFQTPEKLRSAPGHLGLSSMRERAETAGGSCQIRSLPNCGTTVEVWIPRAPTVSDPRPVALDAGPLGPDDPVELTGANRTPWISTSTEVGVP